MPVPLAMTGDVSINLVAQFALLPEDEQQSAWVPVNLLGTGCKLEISKFFWNVKSASQKIVSLLLRQ